MKAARKLTGWVLTVAFCLAPVAPACAPAARAQRYCCEEAAPPSYPREDNFFLGRYGTQGGRQSVFKLSDGDEILVERRPSRWEPVRRMGRPPDRFLLSLRTSPRVTWWKGITVYKNELPTPDRPRGRWVELGRVSVSDNRPGSESYLEVPMDKLRGGLVLVFEKAKAFGVHTPVHGMLLTEANDDLAGQHITFIWDKDN
jgi:hypothetical protein